MPVVSLGIELVYEMPAACPALFTKIVAASGPPSVPNRSCEFAKGRHGSGSVGGAFKTKAVQ